MTNMLLIVFLSLVSLMSAVWIVYRVLQNPSVVDVAWPIGLMIAGLLYLRSAEPMTLRIDIISVLLVIWGMRLAGYLYLSRIRKNHIDKRYQALSDTWRIAKPLGFFLNFQLQGLLIFIISISFFFASVDQPPTMSNVDFLAICITIIGIIGESIADMQLQFFKKTHQQAVCNVGLWRYSRHPNYFFDWLTWCGFALFGFHHAIGYLSVLSPVCLYIIFTRITGPMTELGSIESRGIAYKAYQKITPMFFPWVR